MSELRSVLEEYLAVRRSLGYRLRKTRQLLKRFLAAMEDAGVDVITTEFAVRWAAGTEHLSNQWRRQRLGVVRGFAQFCKARDSRHEVPPIRLLARQSPRPTPYIYTPDEIARIVEAASRLSTKTLSPWTYSTLFGLLAVTGARIGELIALNEADVDFRRRLLVIKQAKFGKSRLVPLHESTCEALQRYVAFRDRMVPKRSSPSFFVSYRGRRLHYGTTGKMFRDLTRQMGIRTADKQPRIHDLRHTFAVRTLIDWYRAGCNVEQKLPLLTTYLGHRLVKHTYWYLSASPELLSLASARLEAASGELP